MAQPGPVHRCGQDRHEHASARIRRLRNTRGRSREITGQPRDQNGAAPRRTTVTTLTPTATVQGWLDGFAAALSRGDYDEADEMFGADAYWRALVSFTTNHKT